MWKTPILTRVNYFSEEKKFKKNLKIKKTMN